MSIADQYARPGWAIEQCERVRVVRMQKVAGGIDYVTPYFSTEGGAFAYGLIGRYRDDWFGIQPDIRFNQRLMGKFVAWQQEGVARLQHWLGKKDDEWASLMTQQMFISGTLWRFGPNLISCKAGAELTGILEAGLDQIRRRLEMGSPVSEEHTNLAVLLEGVDCASDVPATA